ncbi:conserved hypothetical protein [Ricinus communis]|uniref:Uncharacterized protein n=1 Tax=Ricinus communis TaxID=3988 RepID=B9RCT0_RICCO|nr:conserved hypothetical protein [Ricinus communis]
MNEAIAACKDVQGFVPGLGKWYQKSKHGLTTLKLHMEDGGNVKEPPPSSGFWTTEMNEAVTSQFPPNM